MPLHWIFIPLCLDSLPEGAVHPYRALGDYSVLDVVGDEANIPVLLGDLLVLHLEVVFLFGGSMAEDCRLGLFDCVDFGARQHRFQSWQRHKLIIVNHI